MEKQHFYLDTNILIDFPNIFDFLPKDCFIYVADRVITELDGLKRTEDPFLSKKISKVFTSLINNYKEDKFIIIEIDKIGSVDNALINKAKETNSILITNDKCILLKCEASKVSYQTFSEENYTGIRYYSTQEFSRESLEFACQNEDFIDDFLVPFHQNEFLIMENGNNPKKPSVFIKKGKEMVYIPDKILYKVYTTGYDFLKARNIEQACWLYLLADETVTIKTINGAFGVGKSYLTLVYALDLLHQGKISKLIIVPNNSFGKNTRDFPAVPGDMFVKELPHIGTLVDIAGLDEVIRYLENDQIEILPLAVARGRNFTNSMVVALESQNLTSEHVQLLIGRCAENTQIIFDGDIKQVDQKIFKEENGIIHLSNLKDSPFDKIYGCVKLQKVERSNTAQAAAYLNEL